MRLRTRLRNAALALFSRSYEAGGAGARWPVAATMASPVQQGLASRAIISRRASWLVANAPLGESAVLCWTTNLCGDGPSVRSRHPNEAIRAALEQAWNDGFYGRADVEGGDLCGFLGRVVRCLVVHGEAFVRLLTTPRGELRLQLLNPEQVDPALNQEREGGVRIVAGVELGPNGERLAYWVQPESPDQWVTTIALPVRIPSDDIMHRRAA